METLNNAIDTSSVYVDSALSNLDNTVISYGLIAAFLAIIGFSHKLPEGILRLFDRPLFRILVVFLIFLLTRKNMPIALLATIAVLVMMNTLTYYKMGKEPMDGEEMMGEEMMGEEMMREGTTGEYMSQKMGEMRSEQLMMPQGEIKMSPEENSYDFLGQSSYEKFSGEDTLPKMEEYRKIDRMQEMEEMHKMHKMSSNGDIDNVNFDKSSKHGNDDSSSFSIDNLALLKCAGRVDGNVGQLTGYEGMDHGYSAL